MSKRILLLLLLIGIAGLVWWGLERSGQQAEEPAVEQPTHADAEAVGLGFMQDVVLAAPPADEVALDRIYAVLSDRAKSEVARETLSNDIARFVGIQDVPDEGISVEDLEVISDTQATLVLRLNYSGGQVLRDVALVVEDGVWKVNAVAPREDLRDDGFVPDDVGDATPPPAHAPAPAPSPTPPPAPIDNGNGSVSDGACYVGGCSSHVCSDNPDVVTTCEWRPEYACYREATCERQTSGECGWTMTPALQACLVNPEEVE